MTPSSPTPHDSPPSLTTGRQRPRPAWTAGRIVALVGGVLALVGALGSVAVGGAILFVDHEKRVGDYLTSDEILLTTEGYAVVADEIDLEGLPSDSLLGRGRLRVTGTDSGQSVFVGVARADDVDEYLRSVERATLDEISDPATRYVDHSGGAPVSPPADLDIWVAQSSGTGSQVVDWSVEPGRWAVVVMNADGTAGIDVDADVGLTVPWLREIAATLIGVGGLGLLVGGALIFLARRRPTQPSALTGTR